MFARPWQTPLKWVEEQYKLAQLPNSTGAKLASLLTTVDVMDLREVLLNRLPQLQMSTLIIWRIEDRLLLYSQAKETIALVQDSLLELISNCGPLPYVELPG